MRRHCTTCEQAAPGRYLCHSARATRKRQQRYTAIPLRAACYPVFRHNLFERMFSPTQRLLWAHGATEVEENAGLVANDPAVVASRYRDEIARPNIHLRPIGHGNV